MLCRTEIGISRRWERGKVLLGGLMGCGCGGLGCRGLGVLREARGRVGIVNSGILVSVVVVGK